MNRRLERSRAGEEEAPLCNPHRGEVWRVGLSPTRGAEIQKTRPCVVVSAAGAGRLPLRIVVPITGWNERYARFAWLVRLDPKAANGLAKTSAADAFQVRSVSLYRFVERVGSLPDALVDRIASAIALCVDAP